MSCCCSNMFWNCRVFFHRLCSFTVSLNQPHPAVWASLYTELQFLQRTTEPPVSIKINKINVHTTMFFLFRGLTLTLYVSVPALCFVHTKPQKIRELYRGGGHAPKRHRQKLFNLSVVNSFVCLFFFGSPSRAMFIWTALRTQICIEFTALRGLHSPPNSRDQ